MVAFDGRDAMTQRHIEQLRFKRIGQQQCLFGAEYLSRAIERRHVVLVAVAPIRLPFSSRMESSSGNAGGLFEPKVDGNGTPDRIVGAEGRLADGTVGAPTGMLGLHLLEPGRVYPAGTDT